jgi:hypothetical protein
MRLPWIAALSALALGTGARDAKACGWDDETYRAEATSLPCMMDALVGAFPEHTREYYAKQGELKVRCKSPGVVEGRPDADAGAPR